MAIQFVQSTTGTGVLTLNGVAAGNFLVVWQGIYRAATTQAVVATPTDDNGTFTGGIGGVPALFASSNADIGVGIFYQENAAAGTHNVTPEAATNDHGTLAEFSGVLTSGALDVSNTAKTAQSSHVSQVTGTTASTAQNDELLCIAHVCGAGIGDDPLGYTDPVSGFTTLQKINNNATDIANFHAYDLTNSIGTQSATFDWSAPGEADMSSHACIAAFKQAGGPPAGTVMTPGKRMYSVMYQQG